MNNEVLFYVKLNLFFLSLANQCECFMHVFRLIFAFFPWGKIVKGEKGLPHFKVRGTPEVISFIRLCI